MPAKKSTPKKSQKVIVNFDSDRLNVSVREKKEGESQWTDIGSMDAKIDKEYLDKNKLFQKHLIAFASNLRSQLGCDGLQIHGISFSRFNFRTK